jgi:hypothetical protein
MYSLECGGRYSCCSGNVNITLRVFGYNVIAHKKLVMSKSVNFLFTEMQQCAVL